MKVTLITNSHNGRTERRYNLADPGAAHEVLAALAQRSDQLSVSVRLTSDPSRTVQDETVTEWAQADDATQTAGVR